MNYTEIICKCKQSIRSSNRALKTCGLIKLLGHSKKADALEVMALKLKVDAYDLLLFAEGNQKKFGVAKKLKPKLDIFDTENTPE